jgi:hypothetical protein
VYLIIIILLILYVELSRCVHILIQICEIFLRIVLKREVYKHKHGANINDTTETEMPVDMKLGYSIGQDMS